MNFYDILEVSPLAEPDDIRNSFRRLAKKYHPDVNADEEASDRFQLIYLAYDILQDSEKRKIYDQIQIMKYSMARTGREIDAMHRWQYQASRQAQTYSEMPFNEFQETFLSKLGFHTAQFLAFFMFFLMLCFGISGLLAGGHYIFVETFNGAKVLGYGLWLFGGSFTYASSKALWGIFDVWRN
ncbi:MAG: J domain-containing protein [Bacteroidia bacterium]